MSLVFDTIRAAYPGVRGRFTSELIQALSIFLIKTPDVNQARLIVALTDEVGTLQELMARSAAKRRATGRGMGGGSQVYTVRVIDEAYKAAGRSRFRAQWER